MQLISTCPQSNSVLHEGPDFHLPSSKTNNSQDLEVVHQCLFIGPRKLPIGLSVQIPDFRPKRCKDFGLKGAIYDKGHHVSAKYSHFPQPFKLFCQIPCDYFLTVLPPGILILIFLRVSLVALQIKATLKHQQNVKMLPSQHHDKVSTSKCKIELMFYPTRLEISDGTFSYISSPGNWPFVGMTWFSSLATLCHRIWQVFLSYCHFSPYPGPHELNVIVLNRWIAKVDNVIWVRILSSLCFPSGFVRFGGAKIYSYPMLVQDWCFSRASANNKFPILVREFTLRSEKGGRGRAQLFNSWNVLSYLSLEYTKHCLIWCFCARKFQAISPKRCYLGEGYGVLDSLGALKGTISKKEIAILEL